MNAKYAQQTVRCGRTGSRALSAILDTPADTKGLLVQAAPIKAVAAALTTALAGGNNDLVFTADLKGAAGNSITIRYVNPGVETATETVAVVGKAITVTLRSVGGTLSTAAQVKTAIDGNAAASALISVANAAANDGSGSVIALAATPLIGGVDGTVAPAETMIYAGGFLYFTPTDATVSTTSWVKSAEFTAL